VWFKKYLNQREEMLEKDPKEYIEWLININVSEEE
jgi:hypothetical protein